MPIQDYLNTFCTDLVVTDADVYSDVVKAPGGDLNTPMLVKLKVTEAVDSSDDSATLDIVLETSDTEAFTAVTTLETKSFAQADLALGTFVYFSLQWGVKKYIRLKFDKGTADLTKGKFTATIVKGKETDRV